MCKQVLTLRGFLIQGEIKREVLRTAAQPSTNWDRIAILEFFFLHPAVAPLRISYATGPSSIMPRSPENVFPFAEASEAPAPPPASLGLASLQILLKRASGPRAVPLTASAASASVLSGVSAQSVGATFGINSGESLAANVYSILGGYLASSTVKQKSPPEFNSSGVESGRLFGGRGIAVARNLMASWALAVLGRGPNLTSILP